MSEEIIKGLEAENAGLKNEIELLKAGWIAVRDTGADMSEGLVDAVISINERLKIAVSALEHYSQGAQVIGFDRGKVARDALSKITERSK